MNNKVSLDFIEKRAKFFSKKSPVIIEWLEAAYIQIMEIKKRNGPYSSPKTTISSIKKI